MRSPDAYSTLPLPTTGESWKDSKLSRSVGVRIRVSVRDGVDVEMEMEMEMEITESPVPSYDPREC